jgi:hypothetical protein
MLVRGKLEEVPDFKTSPKLKLYAEKHYTKCMDCAHS